MANNEATNIIKNDTLCVLPWNHLYLNNQGSKSLCCLSSETTISEKTLSQIKHEMRSGFWPNSCQKCQIAENTKGESFRLHNNRVFKQTYNSLINSSNDSVVSTEFLDIRTGNLCNLNCRMCHPDSSSKLISEFQNFSDFKLEPFEEKVYITDLNKVLAESDWSQIKKLHLAGGEPFLHPELNQFLQKLLALKVSKNLDLTFNTNATRIDESIFNLLKNFKSVKMTISLDGLEKINSYIRHPSKWSDIMNFLNAVQSYGFDVGINFTLQIYNILEWPQFVYEFQENRQLQVYLNFLHDPLYLNVQSLPLNKKNSVEEAYHQFPHKNLVLSHMQSALNYMYQSDTSHQFERFNEWTRYLDLKRGQNWLELKPDIL